MRNRTAVLIVAVLCSIPTSGHSEPQPLAQCEATARSTSVTWDNPGEECSDFFILEEEATVVVRLQPAGTFAGTLGAALVLGEMPAASFKHTFVNGTAVDGSPEMTASLGPGLWRLRAFAGVTPPQPCVPGGLPGWVPSCNLAPGAAVGLYRVTASLA